MSKIILIAKNKRKTLASKKPIIVGEIYQARKKYKDKVTINLRMAIYPAWALIFDGWMIELKRIKKRYKEDDGCITPTRIFTKLATFHAQEMNDMNAIIDVMLADEMEWFDKQFVNEVLKND